MQDRKLGLICTLGTTTDPKDVLEEMYACGMTCARINTAYASIDDYKRRIDILRSISDIPVMLDLKGPQIRVMCDGLYTIKNGDEFKAGFYNEPVHFSQDFYDDISNGDAILFENGTIETVIKDRCDSEILLEIKDAGEGVFKSHMGVNVPGKHLDVPKLTSKDLEVLDFAIDINAEYIALSFVRDPSDLIHLHSVIKEKNQYYSPGICVKIEDRLGIGNLEEIIKTAKENEIELSVMIARGDMHVEVPYEKVPMIQKAIIRMCKKYDVTAITATGLLDSMKKNKKPARSEVADLANAVLDGTDGVMLSGECSNSKYPVEAVRTAKRIIDEYSIE